MNAKSTRKRMFDLLLVIVLVLPMLGIDLIGWIIGPPLQALLIFLVG